MQPEQKPKPTSHENDGSIHIRPEAYDAFTKVGAEPVKAQSADAEPQEQENSVNAWLKYLSILGLVILLFTVVLQWGFRTYQVDGTSMLTTFNDKDRLIINSVGRTIARLANSNYIPKRGEIVTFISPENPEEQYIKRVIAFPGERVVLKHGILTVYNTEHPEGFKPDEPYFDQLNTPVTGDIETLVPMDHIFVAGDNRSPGGSYDSRTGLGPVPLELLQGNVIFRFYPL